MLKRSAVVLYQQEFLFCREFSVKLLISDNCKFPRKLREPCKFLAYRNIRESLLFQTVPCPVNEVRQAPEYLRLRLHIPPGVLVFLPSAAHLGNDLLGIKHRIVFQLRKAPHEAFQLPQYPQRISHEGRIFIVFFCQKRPEYGKP